MKKGYLSWLKAVLVCLSVLLGAASAAADDYPSGRWVTIGNSASTEVEFSGDTVYYYQYDFSDLEHTAAVDSWSFPIRTILKNGEKFTVVVRGSNGDYMYETNPDNPDEMWFFSLPDKSYSGSSSIVRKARTAAVTEAPAAQTDAGMSSFLEGLRSGISGFTWQTVNGSTLPVPRSVAVTDLNKDGQKDIVALHTEYDCAYVDFYLNENGSFRNILSDTLSARVAGGVYSLVYLSSDPNARIQIYTVSTDDFVDHYLKVYAFDGAGGLNLVDSIDHYYDGYTDTDNYYQGENQTLTSALYYQFLRNYWNSREEVLIYDNHGGRLEEELGPLPEMTAVTLDEAISGSGGGTVPNQPVSVKGGEVSLAKDNFYILPDSDMAYLTAESVRNMPLQVINYAKNEIYARRGRRFKSGELQAWFDSQAWYNGTVSPEAFHESSLNPVERANAELLSSVEHSLNPNGYVLDVPGYSFDPVYRYAGVQ